MHPMLNIAIRAARSAGDVITRSLERVDTLTISTKSNNEFVSEVDQRAEAIIIDTLSQAYPTHAFLGEETGSSGESDYIWIIDPLDGTTNFLHSYPVFSVSIALQVKGKLEVAVIWDPMRQELFTAERGGGAMLNDRKLRVTRRKSLDGALLGTGFPYRDLRHIDAYMEVFKELMEKTAGIRRPGSAALDLAYVAAGRFDGFWEYALKPWDMAAGILLIQEAGGYVKDFDGGDDCLQKGNIVAGGERVFKEISQIINRHFKTE